MDPKKNAPGPVPVANRENMQSSPNHKTEQAKSERAAPKQRITKAEASRKNGRKSHGPKTPRGKGHSRGNARTHGLYSKELFISEADRPAFAEMRFGLETQLQPSTTLQAIAFDYVVVCHWRVKHAVRLEHSQFARQFQAEQPENERGETLDVEPVIDRWYGSSRADIRMGIRGLEYAMEEFEQHGSLREEAKKFLTSGFGPHFVPLLEEWNTMSRTAILMADQMESHRRDFGDPPDRDDPPPGALGEACHRGDSGDETHVKSRSTSGETPRVVIDPMQGRHMVVKLLEERRNFLKELLVITDQNTLEGKLGAAQSSDFNPRFLADANRELRRALDWFLSLKDKGL